MRWVEVAVTQLGNTVELDAFALLRIRARVESYVNVGVRIEATTGHRNGILNDIAGFSNIRTDIVVVC